MWQQQGLGGRGVGDVSVCMGWVGGSAEGCSQKPHFHVLHMQQMFDMTSQYSRNLKNQVINRSSFIVSEP